MKNVCASNREIETVEVKTTYLSKSEYSERELLYKLC